MQHLTFVVLEVCLATRGRAIHYGTSKVAVDCRPHVPALPPTIFPLIFFSSTAPQAFFRPDRSLAGCRAQTLSRLATLSGHRRRGLDGGEHGGMLGLVGTKRTNSAARKVETICAIARARY